MPNHGRVDRRNNASNPTIQLQESVKPTVLRAITGLMWPTSMSYPSEGGFASQIQGVLFTETKFQLARLSIGKQVICDPVTHTTGLQAYVFVSEYRV